ncbi:MAG: hypothetical protein O7G85_14095 [Planctomycetota bacterium]|nr:hypothetical protein [Planctomycetota bacterium]
MKIPGILICIVLLSLFAGCAGTSTKAVSVAPGAMSQAALNCDACPPCDDFECEELPNGNCLVTCYSQGDVVCQFECDPEVCDQVDCDPSESCPQACPSCVSVESGS